MIPPPAFLPEADFFETVRKKLALRPKTGGWDE